PARGVRYIPGARQRLPDRAELEHEGVVQAGEMLILQGRDNWLGQCHRAGLDRIAGEFTALDENFGENVEGVFDQSGVTVLEGRGDKGIVNISCSARESSSLSLPPPQVFRPTMRMISRLVNDTSFEIGRP